MSKRQGMCNQSDGNNKQAVPLREMAQISQRQNLRDSIHPLFEQIFIECLQYARHYECNLDMLSFTCLQFTQLLFACLFLTVVPEPYTYFIEHLTTLSTVVSTGDAVANKGDKAPDLMKFTLFQRETDSKYVNK